MRLCWFSPLHPAKTDIANFTSDIVRNLRKYCDVTVVHPDDVASDGGCDEISSANITHRMLNEFDYCIYNIGNNYRFHGEILDFALYNPGIVILHDRALHELVYMYLCCSHASDWWSPDVAYRRTMAACYGVEGARVAEAVSRHRVSARDVAGQFPLYEATLERALGVISHNACFVEEIGQRFPKLPRLCLNLPLAPKGPISGVRSRTTGEPIRLVMFGFMGGNRRSAEFVEAWAASPWRTHFTLAVAGEMTDRPRFDHMVTLHGLTDQVRHHGFLSDHQLDSLLQTSDLAVNLRNPSMGEASGSQLRAWANGCATLVSDTGWYALLPDVATLKVSIDREADDIKRVLAELAQNRASLRSLGERGYAELRRHSPDAYVEALVGWLVASSGDFARQWSETALIRLTAQAYAKSLPLNFDQAIPPLLL